MYLALFLGGTRLGKHLNKNSMSRKNSTVSKPESNNINRRYYFWKVCSEKNEVYLLGSIHFGLENFYPLNDNIESTFENSSTLVVEVNTLNTKNMNQLLGECQAFNKVSPSEKVKSPEVYKMIKSALKKIHNSKKILDYLDVYKPWYASNVIQNFLLETTGYSHEMGLDSYFLKKAKSKKNIIELETMKDQFNILNSVDSEVYEELLKKDFINFSLDKKRTEFKNLVSAVIEGDEEKLGRIINNDFYNPLFYRYHEEFIEKRNIDMTNKIQNLLNIEGSYFILVGTTHLIGNNGILNLLKTKGYKVNRL